VLFLSLGPGGRPEPDSSADLAGHPEWAGDDQHPGFFQGFGSDDNVDPPVRRKRRRGRWAAPVISLIVIVAIVGAGAIFVSRWYSARHANYSGPGTGQVLVQVKPGDNATILAPKLVKLGVIKSTAPFIAAARQSAKSGDLVPGTMRLHHHMNAALAWALLVDPKARVQTVVSVQDGERATDIVKAVAKESGKPVAEVMKALNDTAALGLPSFVPKHPVGPAYPLAEGYLYPATYTFQPGTTPLQMFQAMVKKFKDEIASIDLVKAAKAAQFSPAQVITQASILEAEVGPTYYPKVARVIDNRLNLDMTLGLDSTVLYGLGTKGFSLTQSQLAKDTPYNSRIHKGLPPGPIDSPDVAAIQAVLHPAPKTNNWLYFVTVDPDTGKTNFTHDYNQFLTWSKLAAKTIKREGQN